MFWKVEGRTGLYVFFKTVCDVYGLIPEDNYTIPAEAEGIEPPPESRSSLPPLILKREPSEPGPLDSDSSTVIEGFSDHSLSTAGTTKRHRHSPSVGATAVHTVVEENEEEDEQPREQPRPITQIFDSTTEEDGDVTAIEGLGEAKDRADATEEPVSAIAATTETFGQAEKQDADAEAGVKPSPLEEEEKQPQHTDAEQLGTDALKSTVSNTKTVEDAALASDSQATEEGHKATTKQQEKADKAEAPSEAVDEA